MSLYNSIFTNGSKKIALLIDPDKTQGEWLQFVCKKAESVGIDMILVGGSILWQSIQNTVMQIKKECSIPVILFPGNGMQVCDNADGILFMSLISGRNPDFLIGQQVLAAPMIKQTKLEVLPTGYLLIESGKTTAVEYMSNTKPIPANKIDIAVATVLAGEMLGLKQFYLEGGSGADQGITTEMIKTIRHTTSLPLIVGGGIRTIDEMKRVFNAGADIVVLGTIIEQHPEMIEAFGKAKN